MKSIVLADKNSCTACGACKMTCPKGCISMEPDELDCLYPVIDATQCVACGKCVKVCPALQSQPQRYQPEQAFAAWNTDPDIRERAASGGIASAIYAYCLQQGIKTYGVSFAPGGSASYLPICNAQDVEKCRNSKYVFSDVTPVLEDIKQALDAGEQVILPGLPCQLAAVRGYVGENREGLTLVDIVCHGTCPDAYVNQHITNVQIRKNRNADQVSFRDPAFGTNRFIFSVKDGDKTIYSARVHGSDTYQLGYHKALNYRENCFHCAYANAQRVGDLTISDFSGLGRLAPFTQPRKWVSCVLVNSPKGRALWQILQAQGYVQAEERPLDEALKYEKQLQRPSVPHPKRSVFVEQYKKSGHYDAAAKKALKKDIFINTVKNTLHTDFWMSCAAKLLPKKIKTMLKKVGSRNG